MVNSISPVNKAVIMCPKGGLGNRIINLIGGIYFARLLDCEFFVYWKPCHLCDCEFYDIFANTNITFLASCEYKALKEQSDLVITSLVLKTERTIFSRGINKSRHIELVDQDLLLKNNIIIHTSHILPNFIDNSDIVSILGELLFRDEIYKKAYSFIKSNNIDYKVKGYHGRFTDCYNREKNYNNLNYTNKQLMFDSINNSSTRYFVCSCERELEKELVNIKNVVLRPKNHYPVFYTSYEEVCKSSLDLDKRGLITAVTLFPLNYISKNAVIDGIIDMLILSRTAMVKAIPSTFWDLACWYSHVYMSERYIKINGKITLL